MSAVNLLSPVLTGGVQNVNFVNGRVLTAADLTAERTANLQRQRLLGQGIGTGVASGLAVTMPATSPPAGAQTVHVTAGLAINANGDLLQLTSDADVALTPAATAAAANAGLFAPCQPPQTQLSNPGIYVLTILPASGYQGQAPVVQLGSSGVAQSCTSQYATAGVQFRLLQLTLDPNSALQENLLTLAGAVQALLDGNAAPATVAPQLSQLRNGLAYACFGAEAFERYGANPLDFLAGTSSFDTYGLLDQARATGQLSACEVPLSLVYWTTTGIQFVDMWSARRRLTRPPVSDNIPLLDGDRRVSEAEAMLLQFEDQVQSLLSGPAALSSISADNYFLYLPPAGLVEVTGNGITAVSGGPLTGFDLTAFFGAHASEDIATTNGNRLRALFEDSLYQEPVSLSQVHEIQLYLVWENLEAVNKGTQQSLAVVFASPALTYRGVARFGTAKWGLSRFAPHVI